MDSTLFGKQKYDIEKSLSNINIIRNRINRCNYGGEYALLYHRTCEYRCICKNYIINNYHTHTHITNNIILGVCLN